MDKKKILKDVVEFKQEFVQLINDEAELPSVILDKYNVVTLLSKSKRSEVYLIEEKESHIKCILKKYEKTVGDEANVLKELAHPAIPTFIESRTINNKNYLIREYFDGITLAEYMENNGVFSVSRAIKISKNLLNVLEYLHTRKTPIIYRDIKAENIIIDKDENIKLIDFDISRKFDKQSSKDTVYYGTKQYSPPEQFGYSQTDARTDIYAVGVLIAYLTTFTTDLNRVDELEKTELKKVIKKCTAFSPKDRYKNVKELERALTKAEKTKITGVSFIQRVAIAVLCLAVGIVFGILIKKNDSSVVFNDIDNKSEDSIENTVDFESDIIEAAVRAQLNKDDGEIIYLNELEQIEYLYICGKNYYDDSRELLISVSPDYKDVYIHFDDYNENTKTILTRGNIKTLDDLLMFNNIKSLVLVYQNIQDISALSHLPLVDVNISVNNISDISPLKDCIGIISLNLDGNPISDISALSNISYLRNLSASGTAINNLSPLSKLYKLEFLYINDAFIDDITPLAELELRHLFLKNNKIKDFSSLPPIENLQIEGNPVQK